MIALFKLTHYYIQTDPLPKFDKRIELPRIASSLLARKADLSEKICPPCAGKFGFHFPIEVVVTPSPLIQKAADKCGVFAA